MHMKQQIHALMLAKQYDNLILTVFVLVCIASAAAAAAARPLSPRAASAGEDSTSADYIQQFPQRRPGGQDTRNSEVSGNHGRSGVEAEAAMVDNVHPHECGTIMRRGDVLMRGQTPPPGSPPNIHTAGGNSVAHDPAAAGVLIGSTPPPGSPPSYNR